MKFKVGDKVRVREDLEVFTKYGNYTFVKGMEEYKGKEFIIDEVCTDYYRLKDIGYCWTDEMLEPIEKERKEMNIEELNKQYKSKMDALMEEYKTKVKEIAEEEEPFIKEGQEYFYIDSVGDVCSDWYNAPIDPKRLDNGNMFPFTEETEDKVRKEVELIAERRKLQSEMEMFARLNNEGEIDWNNYEQMKWYLCINHSNNNEITVEYNHYFRELNTTYFTSKEIAEKALIKFEDRIRKLYLDVEE